MVPVYRPVAVIVPVMSAMELAVVDSLSAVKAERKAGAGVGGRHPSEQKNRRQHGDSSVHDAHNAFFTGLPESVATSFNALHAGRVDGRRTSG